MTTQATARAAMTAVAVQHLKPGEWVSDHTPGRGGKLVARGLQDGTTMFYFRYTRRTGARAALPLGVFSRDGSKGMSLDAARSAAADLRQRYQNGEHDLHAATARDHRTKERAAVDEADRTLGKLLTAYADHLEAHGKESAHAVRLSLFLHVRDAYPELWSAPLADVDTDDLIDVVTAVVESGHLREADKLRSYLRTAYNAGIRARTSATASALRGLGIKANPARDITPVEGANNARNRAISLAELRAYWSRIQSPTDAVLRFHLLTGGQRIAQIRRATCADFDADTQTLRLLDGKGRRSKPREHRVPVLPLAAVAKDDMHGGAAGPRVFTVTAGATGAGYKVVSDRIEKVCAAMIAAGELANGPFTPGDLRRTIDTRLGDAGVRPDALEYMQSHDLGGVRRRHYDRHDYLPQSREALETLHRLLTEPDTVTA